MIELRALKSFLGERGESSHPDNMVRRGEPFATDNKIRADELKRNGLAEDADASAAKPSNKSKPKFLGKPMPASAQKSKAVRAPLSDAEKASRAAKSKATKEANKAKASGPTGEVGSSSSSDQDPARGLIASDLPPQSDDPDQDDAPNVEDEADADEQTDLLS